jgi:hypothetical protein
MKESKMYRVWQCVRAALKTVARRHARPLSLETLEDRRVLSHGFAPILPDVSYHGGPLLTSVQVQSVYYGTSWSSNDGQQQLIQEENGFLNYFVTSPYMTALNQYKVGNGTFFGSDVVNQDQAHQGIDDTQIRLVLNSEIAAKHVAAPGANTLYVFYTAPGVLVTAQGQNSAVNFSGYHDVFTDSAGATVYYAVLPYPTGAGQLTTFQQTTVTLSHEIAEAATDPDTQTGWFDSRFGEIADIANGQYGTLHGYSVSGVWSQSAGQVVLPSDTSATALQVLGTSIQATTNMAFTGTVATIGNAVSGETSANFTATIDWGDGTTSTGTVVADPNGGFDVVGTHTYTTGGDTGEGGEGWWRGAPRFPNHGRNFGSGVSSFTVGVTVYDSVTTNTATAVSLATVTPTAPNLVVTGQNISATSGTSFTTNVATFTDADGNTDPTKYKAVIVWGDGSVSAGTVTADPTKGFDVSGTHTYANGGIYNVYVTLRDGDGDSAVSLGTATVPGAAALTSVALGFLGSREHCGDLVTQYYHEFLGRTPGGSEVDYWVNQMQNGMTDTQVMTGFLSSAEFFDRSGGNNQAWLDALYQDLLSRGADANGLNSWMQSLAGGARLSDVVSGFVNSQEYQGLVVQVDYQQYLGRTAAAGEVAYWVNTMQGGASDMQLAAAIFNSNEYYARAGNSDPTWLSGLYRNVLNRNADSGGESYWLQVMAAGAQ